MMTLGSIQTQIEYVDRKILDLIAQRKRLCTALREETGAREQMEDTIMFWVEEGGGQNLDEVALERLSRMVMTMCWKETE